MSKLSTFDYRYQVCPFCNSKRVELVAMVRLNPGEYNRAVSMIRRTGYFCNNCNRYHLTGQIKFMFDRKEMRRDIASLQKFLEGDQS